MRKVDIVIMGAGLAASTAAALLTQKKYKVVMISRDSGTTHHLPESWIYSSPSIFKSLRIEKKIESFVRRNSTVVFCSHHGKYQFEISFRKNEETEGDLVTIDRNSFDKVLLDAALEAGAELLSNNPIRDIRMTSKEIEITTEKQTLKASFIIDATGKTGLLSQYLNLPIKEIPLKRHAGCFTHFEFSIPLSLQSTLVSIPNGYVFCIPISQHRLSIGCFLSKDGINFDSAMASSSLVTDLLKNGQRVLPIIPIRNIERICLQPAGDYFRIIGDAAAFLDPFLSPGIDFAFFSAEKAVETIENNSPDTYTADIQKWLLEERNMIFKKLEKSSWNEIRSLLSDPHLPYGIPFMLQSFSPRINHAVH